ncbi:SIMPL domain-containing protein [Cytophagaceae bacterium DM2B3-1]|uniref:SIMPL domain-containing protein n=1 Tax=Xanthocytophaga flava TaxID=3048013 RepID=A0AAE3QRJ2_9BACT|nr:SIMPL domain-containing protein [Xanthocytophaga flavus]MDJ1468966.1 SIMPL domain-containing protein [Xanthocytophaga flavus]MDJ1481900.1 SIMPL domain-containing protein [Xanthocytophaga flavus]MDJ1492140.1 SIMPL domain-containing protein [Xanthocytophaga flavus]
MKVNYLVISLLFLVGLTKLQAQTTPNQPYVKKIEVTGSAEMEVIPDEIYFNISLKEYFTDKSNKTKVAIETLEKQLQQAVKDAGIAKENLQIENIYGGTPNWWLYTNKKEKPTDILEKKRYVLKVSDLSKIDNILSKVDGKGIENVNIGRYNHSKMAEYRKELKIKALQAAKEKAGYLLQSIGEQVGGVLEVHEAGDTEGMPMPYNQAYLSNRISQVAMEGGDATGSEIDFKKIKIRYEIQAFFSIK